MTGPIDESKVQGNEVSVKEPAPRFGERALSLVPDAARVERGRGHFDEMLAVVPAAIESKESKGLLGRAMDLVTAAPAAATKAMEAGAKLWDAAEAKSAKAGLEATKELAEAGTVLADLSKSVGLDKAAEKTASLVKETMSGGLYTKGKLKAADLTKENLLDDDLFQNLTEKFESDTTTTKEKGSRGMLAGAFGKMARALSANDTARKNLTDKLAKNTYAVRALDLLNVPRRSKVADVLTKAQIDAKPNAEDIKKFLGLAPADKRDYQLLKMKSGDYFFVPTAAKDEGKEIVFFQNVASGVFSVIPLDGSTPPMRPRNSVAEAAVLWAFGEGDWSAVNDPAQGEEKLNKQMGLENQLTELAKKTESLTLEMPVLEKNLADVEGKLKDKKLPVGYTQALTEMQKHLAAELKVMKFDLGQIEREMEQLTQVLALFEGSVSAAPLIEPRASSVIIEPVVDLPPPVLDDLPLPPPVLSDAPLPPPPAPVVDLPPPVLDDVPVPPAMPMAPPMPTAPPAPPAMPAARPAPAGERGALLDAIRAGKTLKKTEGAEAQPAAPKPNPQQSLQDAINKRRGVVEESDSEDEDDGKWN
ncbi:MAG: hypothetical protein KBF71_07380 [Alphaproteobacteria bacterium]|nr:hypothetical protein [Alphaproteobacteria bacterium]